ncbi:Adaptive-response sensory-kinase SasA [Usitatibacter rugosus]|uniref:histidine kinase n=1 Tax=Usitatibacter rugosus TaxID=2732067 RepID=A0A6M4H0J4_9PROT|nr:sensor histidine kinase [Usitatibacter rugosus]QJR12855.1 Adaptive-response sensory-kinase SasA [Usitatibacter rugosus]
MKPFGEGGSRSLLHDVVDWMLAPLAVLWPVSIAVSYAIGSALADGPFDRELSDFANAVSEEIRRAPPGLGAPIRFPVLERARSATADPMFAQISKPSGELVAGDAFVPLPPVDACVRGSVRLRSVTTEEGDLRIACELSGPEGGATVIVQVAEFLDRRREHATRVTLMMMGAVLVFVPIVSGLALLAIYRGLAPIRRLREEIASRDPSDLRPLPVEGAPAEMEPLLKSVNVQMERVRANLDSQRHFVADAAHQLRTPLAALKTQSQLARGAQTLEEASARLDRIAESADHVSHLASQLLSLARADDAKADGERAVNLEVKMRLACLHRSDAAIAKSIHLAFEAPDEPVTVMGDPDLVYEMFLNLVDNAVRYTPEGGEVTARVLGTPAPAAEVEDNGPGVPDADREMVFERFHRVLGSGAPGSGLGLSIVRSIAARYGATVSLSPGREGRGALFRVAFPPGKP